MSNKKVLVSGVTKHDNPLAELVQIACHYDSEILLEDDNRKINAKSIMGIMAFGLDAGMQVNIIADGKDEDAAIEALASFLSC